MDNGFPTCKNEALALAYVLKMDKTVTKPEEILEIYEDALKRISEGTAAAIDSSWTV